VNRFIERHFTKILLLVLVFSFLVRIIPTHDNNFYFTMDQGNDAIHVRQLRYLHTPLMRGTETGGIPGLYTGPAWYWLILSGFLVSNDHPIGPVIFLIAINLLTTYYLVRYLKTKTNPTVALVIGMALQFFWPNYDVTRYAFNPFLLVPLSLLLIFSLVDVLNGREKSLLLTAVAIGASFHFEIATGLAWVLFFIVILAYLIITKRVTSKIILVSLLVFSLFFLPHFFHELSHGFPQTNAVIHHLSSAGSVAGKTQFKKMLTIFTDLINQGIIYNQSTIDDFLIIFLSLYLTLKTKSISVTAGQFAYNFFQLTLILMLISYFWFGSTTGWQTWHTVYLPPLLFIAFLLINLTHPNKISLLIVTLMIFTQSLVFIKNYRYYFNPNDDPSLLRNELLALDWIYQQTDHKSVSVYTFIPSVNDYNYQYLFWWYGKSRYGYLPCEFNTYPSAPKTYLPDRYQHFETPLGNCPPQSIFLIIEPRPDGYIDPDWYAGVSKNTSLVANTSIGKIRLEKRLPLR